ncbi:MAG: hypothetical protein AB1792_09420 [Candidatus Zixiibacteriota bacterium]
MTNTAPPANTPGGEPAERYRYIGFEVFPKHAPRFWKSDAEAKQYLDRVKVGGGESLLNRDFSLLQQEAMSRIDRIILTVTAVLLVATVVMPWVGYETAGKAEISMSWVSALGTMFGGLGTAFGGGLWVGLSALLVLVLMLGSPILGVWILMSVWGKAPSAEAYQARLRRPLSYGHFLWGAGVLVVILSFAGGSIPGYQDWGLIDPGEKYGIAALMTITSFGPWVAMAMGLVAGVKSGDL